jgi:phosphatidylglycerophosphate synthase
MAQLIFALVVGLGFMFATAMWLVGLSPVPLGLAAAGYLAGAIFAIGAISRGFPYSRLGAGNLVTLARMALVAALLAPLLGVSWSWAIVSVAILALSLDGIDGWLARREGRVSEFGARLDMEVDSALALILALNVWAAGALGPLIVLIGLPRYGFVAVARFVPWLNQPLPERSGRKVVCVWQGATLVALNSPVLPDWLILPVVGGVAGALLWSFGRDIVWLWRSRP